MKFREINVKCPFYITADANKIRCEGAFDKSKITMAFKTEAEAGMVFTDYCCANYQSCFLYQAIFKNID